MNSFATVMHEIAPPCDIRIVTKRSLDSCVNRHVRASMVSLSSRLWCDRIVQESSFRVLGGGLARPCFSISPTRCLASMTELSFAFVPYDGFQHVCTAYMFPPLYVPIGLSYLQVLHVVRARCPVCVRVRVFLFGDLPCDSCLYGKNGKIPPHPPEVDQSKAKPGPRVR